MLIIGMREDGVYLELDKGIKLVSKKSYERLKEDERLRLIAIRFVEMVCENIEKMELTEGEKLIAEMIVIETINRAAINAMIKTAEDAESNNI